MSLVFSAFIFLNYYRNFKTHSQEEKKLHEVKITLIKSHPAEEKKLHEVKITLTKTHSEVKKKLHEKEKLLGWRRNVQWEVQIRPA